MTDFPIHILLADDDKDDCLFFRDALNELEISPTFTEVYDGEQLMRYLEAGKDLPTVIFLDLNMPRKNGFACLDDIKCNDHLKHIAVIIFSTFYDKKIADQLYEKGAHYYICKPASFSQLKMTIGHALSLISKGQLAQPPRENFILCNLQR